MKNAKSDYVTDYWEQFYATEHCTICGNHGVIDSRGVKTPAGYEVGRLNWCICPNGQALRAQAHALPTGEPPTGFPLRRATLEP